MCRDRVHWGGPSNSDQLNLLRGGRVEDNQKKTFPLFLSFTGRGSEIRGNRFLEVKVKAGFGQWKIAAPRHEGEN
jgi:hypothetical protein